MSCSIEYQDSSQLSCTFPENVENAFAVFYSPDSGSERMVVNCVKHQELECNNERGFFSKLLAPDRAEITLPDSFKKQYGSFRCEIPGLPSEKVKSCQWSPPVLEHPQEYNGLIKTNLQTSEDSSRFRDSSEHSTNRDDTSVTYIGLGIGLFSLVILILVIALVLFKRTKSRKNRNPEEPDITGLWSKEASVGAGNREWVPCISPPRLAVSVTDMEGYHTAEISLSTQQSQLIHTDPPRVFLAGPPGAGKTVVLLLKAIQWLRGGHDVCVVSTGWWSLAASNMLFFLLLQTKKKLQEEKISTGQLHFLKYNFNDEAEIDKAVEDLSDAARNGSLYVIADEARPEKWCTRSSFKMFCDKLIVRVPLLYIWASSYFIRDQTDVCRVEYLTTPFRYPSPVLEEVEQEKSAEVLPYSRSNALVHPDGPPVRRIHHVNHSDGPIEDCAKCGHEIAVFLHTLRSHDTANTTSSRSTKPPTDLHWRDVLLLASDRIDENLGMVKQLQQDHIPVKVMERDKFINDVATASTDEVWVVNGNHVRGLERKVVVCLMGDNRENIRLCHMARCTSQLVIVDNCSNVETEVTTRHPKRINCFIL